VTGRLFANDAARLNVWSYGSVGTAPTFIAGTYRTNAGSFSATGNDAMMYLNGHLYGATSNPSTTLKRGVYEVNPVPDAGAHCVMTPVWLDPTGTGTSSGTCAFEGMAYNTDDQSVYVLNTTDTTGTGGSYQKALYKLNLFGDGSLTKIV